LLRFNATGAIIWPMNPFDRKLAGVFKALAKGTPDDAKAQKANKDFRNVHERVVDDALGAKIDFLFKDFSRPLAERHKPAPEEAVESVCALRDKGFSETAAFAFSVWHDATEKLSLQQALNAAPTLACFTAWAKARRISAEEIEQSSLANPDELYTTVGADWLLARAKPRDVLPLLEFCLARRPRPKYLPQWDEALTVALKKDKRGNLLAFVLQHSWPNEDPLRALSEAVRSNRTAFKMTVDHLPAILARKESNSSCVVFVESLFDALVMTDGVEREFETAAMARLGTGILVADRRGQQSEAVLRLIQQLAHRLRNLTRDEAQESRTWVFENLSRDDATPDGKLRVTLEGARHLALAFQKAEQGFAPKDILTVTALNLGLSPISKKGETVVFNPLRHQDIEGGLLPGESAVVEEGGWRFGKKP